MPLTRESIRDAIKSAIANDLKAAESVFDNLDAKGEKDGFVDLNDLGKGIVGFTKKYDDNNDGKVSKDEYMNHVAHDALSRKFDVRADDLSGLEDSVDLPDFQRMLEGLGMKVEPKDEDELLQLLRMFHSGAEEGIAYLNFKAILMEMYSKPDSEGKDDEAKALLRECQHKLPGDKETVEGWTKEFNSLDRNGNGYLDMADFTGDASISEVLKRLKSLKIILDKDDISKPREKVVLLAEFLNVKTMEKWDATLKKALMLHELPTLITRTQISGLLQASGVKLATEAAVEKIYRRMPAKEFSVSYDDFDTGIVQFVRGSL